MTRIEEGWEEAEGGRTPRVASRYFALLLRRNFSEADEILKRMREKATTDWEWGYLNAMEGLMTSFRSEGDELLYVNKIRGDASAPRKARARFLRVRRGPKVLRIPFEEGFAKCWLDFLKVLESPSKEGS